MNPRIVIPKSSISSSLGGPVTIDKIEIGDVAIPNMNMVQFAGDFSYDSCTAKDVEIEIKLSIKSTFDGDIDLPDPLGTYGVSGGVDFSTFTEAHSLGDIDMNSGSFHMLAPLLTAGPLSLTAGPIESEPGKQISVDSVKVKTIKMKCTEVPIDNPLGFYLGNSIPFQNPMKPNDVLVEETNMQQLDSSNIQTPYLKMEKISVKNIVIPSVSTNAIEISTGSIMTVSTSKKMYGTGVSRHGDAERESITGHVTITVESVTMRIRGGLQFKNIMGSMTTDSATTENLSMNLGIKNVKIKGLNICGMNIPEVVMEF